MVKIAGVGGCTPPCTRPRFSEFPLSLTGAGQGGTAQDCAAARRIYFQFVLGKGRVREQTPAFDVENKVSHSICTLIDYT